MPRQGHGVERGRDLYLWVQKRRCTCHDTGGGVHLRERVPGFYSPLRPTKETTLVHLSEPESPLSLDTAYHLAHN